MQICSLSFRYQNTVFLTSRDSNTEELLQTQNERGCATPFNFKATVTNTTADGQFTFFTPTDDQATGHPCSELAQKYKQADPRQTLSEILNIKGKKHVFRIHFSSSTRKGSGDFTVDAILDKPATIQGPSSCEKHIPGTNCCYYTIFKPPSLFLTHP
ncbi:hypothetical protein Tco_0058324 [Tanacetum coccineum]